MNIKSILLGLLVMLSVQNYLIGQDKSDIKFGKVAPEDFNLSKYKFDTGAAAVVIADIGSTSFEGNNKGDFTLIYKRSRRIKILNKNGFDAATDEVEVYKNGEDEEKLDNLKASTYNLENGHVTETKLDDKSVYTEKVDRNYSKKKFTLPAVKEGSIVEISYVIKSDFYTHLQPWNFQGDYPCLWSEYEVTIPQFFNYVFLMQGYEPFFIKTSKSVFASYSVRSPGGTQSDEVYHLSGSAVTSRWVIKDVPALKTESFTSTIRNHISRIEFQLNYVQYGDENPRHDYMGNWYIASEKLLNNESFGVALDKDNHWMSDEIKTISAGSTSVQEIVKKIYSFIRDKFTCTSHNNLYTDNPLKTVFKNRTGNVAEINLLLVAMLRHEGIEANPMILSTRSHGYTSEFYPLITRFNYVICAAKIQDTAYYLDASRPKLGFDQLPYYCYNGQARTINKEKPYVAYFNPDSIKEHKTTMVLIVNGEKGGIEGSYQSVLGKFDSYDTRVKLAEKNEKAFFKDIQTGYGSDIEISNGGIILLDQPEEPVNVHYDFSLNRQKRTLFISTP